MIIEENIITIDTRIGSIIIDFFLKENILREFGTYTPTKEQVKQYLNNS